MYVHICAESMCGGQLRESILSFYPVCPGDQTQVREREREKLTDEDFCCVWCCIELYVWPHMPASKHHY